MRSISLRLPEDLVDELDEEADDRGVARSEYVREVLRKRHDAHELREELEQAEARVEDLRRQLSAVNAREENVGELVEYVESEKRLTERRERREAMRATAGVATRFRWWLTGGPDVESDDRD